MSGYVIVNSYRLRTLGSAEYRKYVEYLSTCECQGACQDRKMCQLAAVSLVGPRKLTLTVLTTLFSLSWLSSCVDAATHFWNSNVWVRACQNALTHIANNANTTNLV